MFSDMFQPFLQEKNMCIYFYCKQDKGMDALRVWSPLITLPPCFLHGSYFKGMFIESRCYIKHDLKNTSAYLNA